MKKLTKLHKKILRILKKLNQREYLHHFGPKKYKLLDHIFAFLVMQICKLSLRKVENFLILFEVEVPTYSALCKSRKRIPAKLWNFLLRETIDFESFSVAVDSTGFSRTNPSFHFVKRIDSKNPVKRYVKLSAFLDLPTRKFLALKVRVKPRHDVMDVKYLLKQIFPSEKLFADSAYDAEWIHEICFDKKIQTIIKPKKNVKKGFYRRKQMKNYSEKEYHQRSLIESGFGALKRKYGGNVSGKVWKSVNSEIYCKAICHNLNLAIN
jgi:transposase